MGADRGYTQCRPEHFHLPVRALGYSLVMDYKAAELGRQANSQGALMVDGAFYCPALPEDLITASADKRAGQLDDVMYKARTEARRCLAPGAQGRADQDGYERFACPAQGEHPHLCCPLRPQANAVGKVPVLSPPAEPPKVCTQSAITVAPDIGARHRQDLAFGSERWASTYAAYRNTVEGWNGYVKDPAHEALAAPGRRRVRGIAAQSIFVTLLLMAGQFQEDRRFSPDGRRQERRQAGRTCPAPAGEPHRLPLPALGAAPETLSAPVPSPDAGFPGLQPAPQHIAPPQSAVTVTAHRDTGLDASRQRSFVAVSGLVVSLTHGADDGIRTRDPHLGKVPQRLHVVCSTLLTWAFVHPVVR